MTIGETAGMFALDQCPKPDTDVYSIPDTIVITYSLDGGLDPYTRR
jgi:hypothetical protein